MVDYNTLIEKNKKRELLASIYRKAKSEDLSWFSEWRALKMENDSLESLADILQMMEIDDKKFQEYLSQVFKSINPNNFDSNVYNFNLNFLERCLVARSLIGDVENVLAINQYLEAFIDSQDEQEITPTYYN